MLGYLISIDKYLIGIKLIYLTFGLQYYAIYQFRSVILIEGYLASAKTFGMMFGSIMFITFFVSVYGAHLIDKYRLCKRNILLGLLFSSLLIIELMIVFKSILIDSLRVWIPFLFYNIFNYPQISILDKAVLDFLRNKKISSKYYSNQKLFEGVGFLITCFFIERLVKPSTKNKNLQINFEGLQIYLLFCAIIACSFIFTFLRRPNTVRIPRGNQARPKFTDLLKSTDYKKFLLIFLFSGLIRTGLSLYTTNFYRSCLKIKRIDVESLGFSRIFLIPFKNCPLTLATSLSTIFEIVSLSTSEYICKLYGLYTLLLLGSLCQLLRVFIYLFAAKRSSYLLFYVCISESLKGLNFGYLQASGVELAEKLAPSGSRNASQVVFYGLYNGISFFISGFMFGSMFKGKMDPKAFIMFYSCILGLIIAKIVLIFLFYFVLSSKLFKKRDEDEYLKKEKEKEKEILEKECEILKKKL